MDPGVSRFINTIESVSQDDCHDGTRLEKDLPIHDVFGVDADPEAYILATSFYDRR
jgi:hypothetical protein